MNEIHEDITKYRAYIIKIANKFTSNSELRKELIQEGYIGILQAKDKYQSEFGISFISYATYWIKKTMYDYLNNNYKQIRIPINQKRNPNFISTTDTISWETPINEENNSVIGDLIPDNIEENNIDNEIIHQIINELSPIDKQIIMSYYGFEPYTQMNMNEIALEFNQSRQNIKQKLVRIEKYIKEKLDGYNIYL